MAKKNRPGQGRPRKPTALKMMENKRVTKFPETEAQPECVLPDAPACLSDGAKAIWERDGNLLVELGLLTSVDSSAFAMYCQSLDDLEKLEDEKQALESLVYTNSLNAVVIQPILTAVNKQRSVVMSVLREFGMTPSSRSGVTIAKKTDKNPYRELQAKRAQRRENKTVGAK